MHDRDRRESHLDRQDAARILIADDDIVIQSVTGRVLQNAGFSVDTANDGRSAIEALENTDYDLVLMDCYMPGMDGFEATRAIRGPDSPAINPDVPVIAFSALEPANAEARWKDAGMNGHIQKSATSEMLVSAIRNWVGMNRPQDSGNNPGSPGPEIDHGIFDSLIDRFAAEVPATIIELNQALAKGRLDELEQISHRLKGSADVIGSSKLSKRASTAEQAARNGELAKARAPIQDLVDALEELASALSDAGLQA